MSASIFFSIIIEVILSKLPNQQELEQKIIITVTTPNNSEIPPLYNTSPAKGSAKYKIWQSQNYKVEYEVVEPKRSQASTPKIRRATKLKNDDCCAIL